jgi:hypothetical protein
MATPQYEVGPEKRVVDILRTPDVTDEQIAELSEKAEESDSALASHEALTQLETVDRIAVVQNLARLRDRIQEKADASDEQVKLLERIQKVEDQLKEKLLPEEKSPMEYPEVRSPETPPEQKPALPKETEKEPRFLERVGEQVKKHPYLTTALGVSVIYLIARWFNRAKNSGVEAAKATKGSWWKKLLIGLGVGTLVAVVGHSFLKRFDWYNKKIAEFEKQLSNIADVAKGGVTIVEKIGEGLKAGAEKTAQLLGPAASSAVSRFEAVQQVWRDIGKYPSDAAFEVALLAAIAKSGAGFVWDAAGVSLTAGGNVIACNKDFYTKIVSHFEQGDLWSANGLGDIFATYIEGSIVFGTSLTALKLFTLNRVGKGADVLWESALWPVYSVKRGLSAGRRGVGMAWYATDFARAKQMGFSTLKTSAKLNITLPLGRWFSVSEEGLATRWLLARDTAERLSKAKANRYVSNVTKNVPEFTRVEEYALEELQKYLQAMKKNGIAIPTWAQDAINIDHAGVPTEKLSTGALSEIIQRGYPPSMKTAVSSASGASADAARAGDVIEEAEEIVRTPRPGNAKVAVGEGTVRETAPAEASLARPKLRIVPAEDLAEAPAAAQRIVAREARDAAEAAEMTRGISTLAKLGVGINTLLVTYEGYQVAQLWIQVGRLSEIKDVDRLLRDAYENRKCVALASTGTLALDAIAAGVGTVHVLTGQLALLATGTGGLALIAIPLGASISAGMYSSIKDFELQNKITIRQRIEGIDEAALGRSKVEQLHSLSGVPLTLRLGAGLTTATVGDFEKLNREQREDILFSMVLQRLRAVSPHLYQELLGTLGPSGINELRHMPVIETAIIPFLRNELVSRARTRGNLSTDDMRQLEDLKIKKGWFGAYLTEDDVRAVVADAELLLEAWVKDSDHAVLELTRAKETIAKTSQEQLAEARLRVEQIFGEHAQEILRMPLSALTKLRQEHANVLVDVQYFNHSNLKGIIEMRKALGGKFAGDEETGIALIRDRLDALNTFMQVTHRFPKLEIRPLEKFNQYEMAVTPIGGFLHAGEYRVTDISAAAVRGPTPPQYLGYSSPEDMQKASQSTRWYQEAVGRYRRLLDRFSAEEPRAERNAA